jgi:hypothetical protein
MSYHLNFFSLSTRKEGASQCDLLQALNPPLVWPQIVPLKLKGGPDERKADLKSLQRNALQRLTCHSLLIKDPEQKSTDNTAYIRKL